MRIAWIQYDITWKNSNENISFVIETVESSQNSFDLLVLPEMFDTGFVLDPTDLGDRDQEAVLNKIQQLSIHHTFDIVFSMIWKEGDDYFNRAFYVAGNHASHYDKVHLFAPGGEAKYFKAGEERNTIKTKGGTSVLPLICYDLRFPEISRNKGDIDLIIYSASWPEARTSHWDTLLKARAIENQCYVLGVNRVGLDGNNLNYIGHSQLIDFYGNKVNTHNEVSIEIQGLFIAEADFSKMHSFRNKLPFLKDISYKN